MNHEIMHNPRKVENIQDNSLLPFEALKKFRLIFKAVQQHSLTVESSYGVSSAQIWAMSEIANTPEIRVTDLAKQMALHHSTISNLLDKLEKKDLLIRARNANDQRVVTISLTVKGTALINAMTLPARGLLQQALFELPDEILLQLTENLDQLIVNMNITNTEAALQPMDPLLSNK